MNYSILKKAIGWGSLLAVGVIFFICCIVLMFIYAPVYVVAIVIALVVLVPISSGLIYKHLERQGKE